jgi:hypothetical protein
MLTMGGRCGQRPWFQSQSGFTGFLHTEHLTLFTTAVLVWFFKVVSLTVNENEIPHAQHHFEYRLGGDAR